MSSLEMELDQLSTNYMSHLKRGCFAGGAWRYTDPLVSRARDLPGVGIIQDHCAATVLAFGLNPSDELSFSGGVGLSSTTNAQIEVIYPENVDGALYVHHHATLQIDPNTGVITRALDV